MESAEIITSLEKADEKANRTDRLRVWHLMLFEATGDGSCRGRGSALLCRQQPSSGKRNWGRTFAKGRFKWTEALDPFARSPDSSVCRRNRMQPMLNSLRRLYNTRMWTYSSLKTTWENTGPFKDCTESLSIQRISLLVNFEVLIRLD